MGTEYTKLLAKYNQLSSEERGKNRGILRNRSIDFADSAKSKPFKINDL